MRRTNVQPNGRERAAWGLCVALSLCVGCSRDAALPEIAPPPPHVPVGGLKVPGSCAWADTGIDIIAGQPVTVLARGAVAYRGPSLLHPNAPYQSGPEGTYLFSEDVAEELFPLPAAAGGPAPCYCLIGRIGAGAPFYVGRRTSWIAAQSGRLFLGINDFDLSDNSGGFRAQVTLPQSLQPIALEEVVSESGVESPETRAGVVERREPDSPAVDSGP
ncbi:MAG: hypothetical protein ACREIV_15320, partial [Planctomycetaceae bacterium]